MAIVSQLVASLANGHGPRHQRVPFFVMPIVMTRRLAVLCVICATVVTMASDGRVKPSPADVQRVVGTYVRVAAWPVEERAGGIVALRLDIRPESGIHLFAPGQRGYLAPTLTPTADSGIHAWKTVSVDLPSGEPFVIGGTGERVFVYRAPFTLVQHLRLAEAGSAVAARRRRELPLPGLQRQRLFQAGDLATVVQARALAL